MNEELFQTNENGRDEEVRGDLRRGARTAVNEAQVKSAKEIGQGWREINRRSQTAQGNAQQAGFRAEEYHAATFNADAARQGQAARASLPRNNGPVDVEIKVDGKVVAQAQIKNCKTAPRTTAAISAKKYDGQQKIVPADQVEGVKRLAAKRGPDGLGERNFADTSQKASGQLKHEGVTSKPLTYKQAQDRKLGLKMAAGETGKAAKAGAKGGVIVGGAFSSVSNVKALIDGEKTIGEAAGDMVKDTVKAGVGGAVSAAATSAVTAVGTKAGLSVVSKSGVAGAIAGAGLEMGKDVYAWANGEMSGGEVAGRCVDHAASAGGAWAGAAYGALLGAPVPVVGTVIGGLVGGMLGSTASRKVIQGIRALFN